MPEFICTACGTQFPPSEMPPAGCPICEEERQYVPAAGQSWTTLSALAGSRRNAFHQYEPGVIGIGTEPPFAIGQRAILVRTPAGNVLWDCVAFLDDATKTLIDGLGGLAAIAISHPHFYTTMGAWSRAFGDVPIHLHADDRDWILNPNPNVHLWEGDSFTLLPDVTLIRCGGHFPGANVLHWAGGAGGKGIVCSGDTLTVTVDRKYLTFMWSYPNMIPLPPKTIRGIAAAMAPYAFDTLYGHYWDRVIATDAKAVLDRSIDRYLKAISD